MGGCCGVKIKKPKLPSVKKVVSSVSKAVTKEVKAIAKSPLVKKTIAPVAKQVSSAVKAVPKVIPKVSSASIVKAMSKAFPKVNIPKILPAKIPTPSIKISSLSIKKPIPILGKALTPPKLISIPKTVSIAGVKIDTPSLASPLKAFTPLKLALPAKIELGGTTIKTSPPPVVKQVVKSIQKEIAHVAKVSASTVAAIVEKPLDTPKILATTVSKEIGRVISNVGTEGQIGIANVINETAKPLSLAIKAAETLVATPVKAATTVAESLMKVAGIVEIRTTKSGSTPVAKEAILNKVDELKQSATDIKLLADITDLTNPQNQAVAEKKILNGISQAHALGIFSLLGLLVTLSRD